MASSAPAKLSVEDVLAFSDAELARYMAGKRRPDGGFTFDDIEGWSKQLISEREPLAEKLR